MKLVFVLNSGNEHWTRPRLNWTKCATNCATWTDWTTNWTTNWATSCATSWATNWTTDWATRAGFSDLYTFWKFQDFLLSITFNY